MTYDVGLVSQKVKQLKMCASEMMSMQNAIRNLANSVSNSWSDDKIPEISDVFNDSVRKAAAISDELNEIAALIDHRASAICENETGQQTEGETDEQN